MCSLKHSGLFWYFLLIHTFHRNAASHKPVRLTYSPWAGDDNKTIVLEKQKPFNPFYHFYLPFPFMFFNFPLIVYPCFLCPFYAVLLVPVMSFQQNVLGWISYMKGAMQMKIIVIYFVRILLHKQVSHSQSVHVCLLPHHLHHIPSLSVAVSVSTPFPWSSSSQSGCVTSGCMPSRMCCKITY